MVAESIVSSDWNLSFIINQEKEKPSLGVTIEAWNQEQVMKVMGRILNTFIWNDISIDGMQFSFMPGRSTIDAIFILRQLQEKFIGKKKNL